MMMYYLPNCELPWIVIIPLRAVHFTANMISVKKSRSCSWKRIENCLQGNSVMQTKRRTVTPHHCGSRVLQGTDSLVVLVLVRWVFVWKFSVDTRFITKFGRTKHRICIIHGIFDWMRAKKKVLWHSFRDVLGSQVFLSSVNWLKTDDISEDLNTMGQGH